MTMGVNRTRPRAVRKKKRCHNVAAYGPGGVSRICYGGRTPGRRKAKRIKKRKRR